MIIDSPIISGSLILTGSAAFTGSFATSGSTIHVGNTTVSGSLLVSGSITTNSTITAQTLVVQTITSSISVITGSTQFGSSSINTHQFTGSVLVSGSFGLNKAVPQRQYTQVANTNGIVFTIQNAAASNEGYIAGFDTTGSTYIQLNNSANSPGVYLNSSGSSYIIGGNFGIGATLPTSKLEIVGISGSTGIIPPLSITSFNATTNTGNTSTSYGGLSISNAVDTTLVIRTLGSGHVQLATDASSRYISFATDLFTERVRIASGGNLGIRSTSPRATLHVQQATNDGTPSLGTARDGAVFTSNNGNYGLNITIDPSGDSLMQAMRFDGSATAYALKLQPAGGAVVMPNQPVAMGAMAGDQSVPATSFTAIAFNTSYGFHQANVGSCWNNSTSTFTAPQSGIYLINAGLYTSNVGQIAAFVNGNRYNSMVSTTSTFPTTWHGTLMVKLAASDALTLRGYGDSSGIVYQNTYHSWFGIYFLG
jgi:hypothetical protein